MSPCPEESVLVRWMSGELPPDATLDLEDHLETCEPCRERGNQLRGLWSALGGLDVEPPPRDLTSAILARAAEPQPATINWRIFAPRLAAAIALAAGVGITAGVLTPVRPAAPPLAAVSPEDVLSRTGLDSWTTDQTIIAHVLDLEMQDDLPREEPS